MDFYNSVGIKAKKEETLFFYLRKESHENIIRFLNKIMSLSAVIVICAIRQK